MYLYQHFTDEFYKTFILLSKNILLIADRFLTPKENAMTTLKELYPTFVLPAPQGCNLACPYCVIAQRQEATDTKLSYQDYLHFLMDILVNFKIGKMSIQGFEPLLPETWPLTKAMLRTACKLGCETSVITNGTYLADHAADLGGFFGIADTLTVSLDSYIAEKHDQMRRVSGTFEAAIAGIKALTPNFYGSLQVNSVLMPNRAFYLEDMPELLCKLEIKQWAISPLIQISDTGSHVPQGKQMHLDMERLITKAERFGINVFLSDELRQHEGNDLFTGFYVQTLPREADIFRLSPDASCSRGVEILGHASQGPKWDGEENPSVFLARIFSDVGVEFERRSFLIRRLALWRASLIKKNLGLERR